MACHCYISDKPCLHLDAPGVDSSEFLIFALALYNCKAASSSHVADVKMDRENGSHAVGAAS